MPLNIKITEKDNSVHNTLSTWTNLVKETITEEKSSETREVIFEKYNTFTNLLKQRKKTIKIWNNLGLLEGLNGHVKKNIAELYEAQESCLLNDVFSPIRVKYTIPIGVSSRGFDSKPKRIILKIKSFFISIWNKIFKKKKVETNFGGIVFPLIQRVFARTIGLDLVPVQPMSLPSGMLFYLDSFPQREDVYTRVVLVEKWKPRIRYSNMTFNQDYFIPVRDNIDEHIIILDGPRGR